MGSVFVEVGGVSLFILVLFCFQNHCSLDNKVFLSELLGKKIFLYGPSFTQNQVSHLS